MNVRIAHLGIAHWGAILSGQICIATKCDERRLLLACDESCSHESDANRVKDTENS